MLAGPGAVLCVVKRGDLDHLTAPIDRARRDLQIDMSNWVVITIFDRAIRL